MTVDVLVFMVVRTMGVVDVRLGLGLLLRIMNLGVMDLGVVYLGLVDLVIMLVIMLVRVIPMRIVNMGVVNMRIVDMRIINVRGRLGVLLALVAVCVGSDHNRSD